MPELKNVPAADAAKLFAKQNIKVQTAKLVTVTDEETGKPRQQYETKLVPLGAEHVLSAKKYDDGRTTLVTIDGKKYEAARAASADA